MSEACCSIEYKERMLGRTRAQAVNRRAGGPRRLLTSFRRRHRWRAFRTWNSSD